MFKKKLPITLAFLTALDPRDKKSWSGIYSFMLHELESRVENVLVLGPIARPLLLRAAVSGIAMFHKVWYKKEYDKLRAPLLSRYYAHAFSRKLKKLSCDVLFVPAGSTEIAYLKTSLPICYYSDSSFGQINDYYEQYKGLSDKSKRKSHEIERRALANSSVCVYSSAWAADYIVSHYKKPKKDVFVVKFGANIVPDSTVANDFGRKITPFHILFLGVDWERKGGAKVVDTYKFLKNRGYAVTLTICGSNPKIEEEGVTIIPFLDKNKEEDRRQLQLIMLQTHLLVLPTEADCTPIVLNEAAAFGIPVISTQTGGISSQVEHGVNGFLALDSGDFSRYAELLINDKDLYQQMSKNALLKSQEELSWTKWGEEMTRIIQSLIKK